jgi:hypothetical protein
LQFTLKRKKTESGYLLLNAIPYAEVYIDGKLMGYTPLPKQSLSIGDHVVRFKHPNAPEVVKNVTISKDKEEKLIVTMDVTE